MLHLFLERGAWFSAKSHGYGAGLPIAWQGWALLVAHGGLLGGLGFALQDRPPILIPLVLLAAAAPIPIYAGRTKGGWQWRWGRSNRPDSRKRR
jgi:hypothetical protein